MNPTIQLKPEVDNLLPSISPPCRSPHEESDVQTNYTKFAEIVLRATSSQFQCSMFCGGKKCKYESSWNWSDKDKALGCIYSHWVTDDIVAMSRPNQDMIANHNLIPLFHKNRIGTVINLQEPGEHASCGLALQPSGFSYDPKAFMDNQIFFYNFIWKDFSPVNVKTLLDAVKVMVFALSQGKVAVHCHAGLGRTGVLIAASLMFIHRCQAKDAIQFVRARRPGAIQLRSQIVCLFKFASYISSSFIVYSNVASKKLTVTLNEFLKRQNILLHGKEARSLRYIPKVCEEVNCKRLKLFPKTLFIICEKLLQICEKPDLLDRVYGNTEVDANSESFTRFYLSGSCEKLTHFRPSNHEAMEQKQTETEDEHKDNLEIEKKLSQLITSLEIMDGQQDLSTEIFGNNRKSSYGLTPFSLITAKSIETIVTTLVNAQVDDAIKYNLLYDYQKEINNKPTGWERLCQEDNIHTLCLLLWSWFESLDVPILSSQTLGVIVSNGSTTMKCFYKLNLETRFTLEYIVRFVLRLTKDSNIPDKNLRKLVARLVAALTIKRVRFDHTFLPANKPKWPELASDALENTSKFIIKLMEFISTKT